MKTEIFFQFSLLFYTLFLYRLTFFSLSIFLSKFLCYYLSPLELMTKALDNLIKSEVNASAENSTKLTTMQVLMMKKFAIFVLCNSFT